VTRVNILAATYPVISVKIFIHSPNNSVRELKDNPPVPSRTASQQRQVCISGLPRAVLDSTVRETRTRDLSIAKKRTQLFTEIH